MLFLVRSGPETLVLTFGDGFEYAEEIILKWGDYVSDFPEDAFSAAGEYSRILVARIRKTRENKEVIRVYISDAPLERLLCMMLNSKTGESVLDSRMQPGYIVMRLLGDIDKGIEKIKEDFGGELITNEPFFPDPLPEDSSIIYFTKEPLNHRIPHKSMYKRALYVTDHSKEKLLSTLRIRQNEYLGDSMGTPDWNSMEIQIGDKEKRFNIHRKRIWAAVQGLQIGTILEEGWRREYTLMGKTVNVYILKLFTPLSEEAIKGFLSGLEYDELGERIADLDLFFNGRKVSWKDRGKDGGKSKAQLGIAARQKMLNKLDRYSLTKIQKLEDELKISGK